MNKTEQKAPRILVLDIETSPIVAYTWGPKWESNIIEFIEQSQVICYSAKWLGGKQVTRGLIDYAGYKKGVINDKAIVTDIHGLLEEADVVVTQNGISFDHKVLNARFLSNGLVPPAPFKMVDTKVEAKRYLHLPSYGLDDMGEYFALGRKLSHEGFGLWKRCIAGIPAAWTLMKRYNAQDVLLTEKLYLKIRPFMKTPINMGMFLEKPCCPNCGSMKLQLRGYQRNISAIYRRLQCTDCGAWSKVVTKERSYKANRSI